ncbi:hypothetical protein AAVH_24501 [Aphelenchoides avenae]|nr:hypothetical protein AAVH_24501 [Aphelenchus avenae]
MAELDEAVFKFGALHDNVVDVVNNAFDALNTYWENNDEDYAYKYMEAKPLQRRFEKISDAFHAEQASFRDKAREKVMKHLADHFPGGLARRAREGDNAAQQEHRPGDIPTSSTAVNPGSNTKSPILPSKPTHYDSVAVAPKSVKGATQSVADAARSVPKEKKPRMEKVFICDVCTKKFCLEQGLNDHKKDAHGVPIKPPPTAPKHVMDVYHRQLGIYCQQQMDKLQTE